MQLRSRRLHRLDRRVRLKLSFEHLQCLTDGGDAASTYHRNKAKEKKAAASRAA